MQTADVTIHVDETIDQNKPEAIAGLIEAHPGVVGVTRPDDKPHLIIVKYDPLEVSAHSLLDVVRDQGVHAKLVGL